MRKIGIMVGSDSDLPQCLKGLEYLRAKKNAGKCEISAVITNSIHRNTQDVLRNLGKHRVDVWIIGAGWANHLTGVCDAFLRYSWRDTKTQVIGVAFEDKKNPKNTEAAILSITQIPGGQTIFNGYVGEIGFFLACAAAVHGNFSKIQLKEAALPKIRTLDGAIQQAQNMQKKENQK